MFFVICFISNSVKATGIDMNVIYQENIYSNRINNQTNYSGQLGLVYINGKVVYCIDPYKIIGESYYVGSGEIDDFSNDDLKYFELISYFSFDYLDHNYIEYYMAAQELIWERITNQEIFWTTEKNGNGTVINIDNYKKEIIELINNFYMKPSFFESHIEDYFYNNLILEDTNNVLNRYNINYFGKNEIIKENNLLNIKILTTNEEKIEFNYSINMGENTMYSSNINNQRFIRFELVENQTFSLFLKSKDEYSTRISIKRSDMQNGKIINGYFKFKIKNMTTGKYINYNGNEIFESDINGNYISQFFLNSGNYIIENLEVPSNYVIDNNTFFTIDEEQLSTDGIININDVLSLAFGVITIDKKFIYNDTQIPSNNVRYDIYSKDTILNYFGDIIYSSNHMIESISTNIDGITITSPLMIGSYYLVEVINDSNTNRIFYVDIEYKNANTKIVTKELIIEDMLDKLRLSITTFINVKDKLVPTSDVTYGLYAGEDIYINDLLLIKKDILITTITTNNLGEAHYFDNLPFGNYYILETSNNNILKKLYFNYTVDNKNQKFVLTKEAQNQNNNEEIKVPDKYINLKDDKIIESSNKNISDNLVNNIVSYPNTSSTINTNYKKLIVNILLFCIFLIKCIKK